MATDFYIYKFAEFELDEKEEKLFSNGEEVSLTDKEFRILLLLLQHKNEAVSKEDFLDEIWGLNSDAGESNVSVHIHSLRNKLGGTRDRFIKSEKNKRGYTFVETVEKYKRRKHFSVASIFEPDETDYPKDSLEIGESISNNKNLEIETALEFGTREFTGAALGMSIAATLFYAGYLLRSCFAGCFEQNIYIVLASSFYAILTGIGVFLECAYQFDKYGWRAVKMIPSIFLVAAGAIFAALSAAENQLPEQIGYAIISGCGLLLFGAGVNCFLASFILPGTPITAARIPTQSAFAAFCKNIFIYFFPIYTIFGILVFSLIYSSAPASRNVAYPIGFFVVLLIFFVISHFSTNVLLQNLLTPNDGEEYKYYGLFSSLIIFRQIFCFGAALLSLIYYFSLTIRNIPP